MQYKEYERKRDQHGSRLGLGRTGHFDRRKIKDAA